MRFYRSIYRLPVLNWHEIAHESGDVRHLIIPDDPVTDELPEITPEQKQILEKAWAAICEDLPEGSYDTKLPAMRFSMMESFFKYLDTGITAEYHKAFAGYKMELNKNCTEFILSESSLRKMAAFIDISPIAFLLNKKYESLDPLMDELKEKIGYVDYMRYRAFIIDDIEKVCNKKFDLLSEIVMIERLLENKIDPETCSIGKYMSYRNAATKKAKQLEKMNNGRKSD